MPNIINPYTATVDIEKVTCGCPDFKFRRSRFAKNSEERRCKHLKEMMAHIPVVASKHWSEKKRTPRVEAEKIARIVSNYLYGSESIEKFDFCGSYRRGKDTIGDLDIVIAKKNDDWEDNLQVLERICSISEKVMVSGPQKTSILFGGIQVDLRFVKNENYVFQRMHATGSKDENVRLRAHAKKKGMSLNEYGLFRGKEMIKNILSEEDIYQALELPYVKPENR